MEFLMEKLTLNRHNIEEVCVSAQTIGISVFLSNIIQGFKRNVFSFFLDRKK